ncbi:hypothetical protein BDR04DRAFT_54508 [Suillus decipiens]|nr:hypothetical protein BDR04DRAFT_54508 [Suillus decipiens]
MKELLAFYDRVDVPKAGGRMRTSGQIGDSILHIKLSNEHTHVQTSAESQQSICVLSGTLCGTKLLGQSEKSRLWGHQIVSVCHSAILILLRSLDYRTSISNEPKSCILPYLSPNALDRTSYTITSCHYIITARSLQRRCPSDLFVARLSRKPVDLTASYINKNLLEAAKAVHDSTLFGYVIIEVASRRTIDLMWE